MSTVQNLALWNTNECHERVCQKSKIARHILDADCCREENTFALFSLPRKLPRLFTVRFTAPADFTAGDIITLKGREFSPKTRMMEEPEEKVFSAGAVVQCDIDMERGLAFFTTDGEGGGAVDSVNGLTGAVTLDLPQFPGVQNALDDKADAADLAAYAPINSPALTGTPTAPTPAASAAGNEIMTAEAVNTKLTSNLANTAPSMVRTDGVSTAGSAATVSRSDHEHGMPAATAATATAPGAAGSVVYAADNDTTSRDRAVTPAGLVARSALVEIGSFSSSAASYTITGLTPYVPIYLDVDGSYNVDANYVFTETGTVGAGARRSIASATTINYDANRTMVLIPTESTVVISRYSASNANFTIKVFKSAGSAGAGSIQQYSTEAQDTGQRWIDGKKIYQKSFSGTTGSTIKTEFAITNVGSGAKLLRIDCIIIDSNNSYVQIGQSTLGGFVGSNAGVVFGYVTRAEDIRRPMYGTIWFAND